MTKRNNRKAFRDWHWIINMNLEVDPDEIVILPARDEYEPEDITGITVSIFRHEDKLLFRGFVEYEEETAKQKQIESETDPPWIVRRLLEVNRLYSSEGYLGPCPLTICVRRDREDETLYYVSLNHGFIPCDSPQIYFHGEQLFVS